MSDIQAAFLLIAFVIACVVFVVVCFLFRGMFNNKTLTVTKEEKTHLDFPEKT
jgi:uncharacterized membrane protein YvbJ